MFLGFVSVSLRNFVRKPCFFKTLQDVMAAPLGAEANGFGHVMLLFTEAFGLRDACFPKEVEPMAKKIRALGEDIVHLDTTLSS